MLPHEEPMTDKQLRYLRHLIHPSEWHTIDRSMTKMQASEEIEKRKWENAADLAAVRALSKSPQRVWSPRHGKYIVECPNQKRPTLAELLPPPEPEPERPSYTRDQFVQLMSVVSADEAYRISEVVQDMTGAEIDELIAERKKQRALEQEAERKAAEERSAREAKKEEEDVRQWRLDSGLPAVTPPGDERITEKQARLLKDLLGDWVSHRIRSLTKKEAWRIIHELVQPAEEDSDKAHQSWRYRKVDRAFMEADFGDG